MESSLYLYLNLNWFKMKKVLVTGATGFIGNYIIPLLLKKGYAVTASSSSVDKASCFSWFSDVNYVAFNFKHFDPSVNYFDRFNSPDLMIHLAWEGLPNYKAAFHIEENLPRHAAFLENLVSNGLKDLTVTGTCLEYGFHEGKLDEAMEADPSNAYAIAKDKLRMFLQELQGRYTFHLKWVRLFYMYGKGQNPNAIFSQLETAIEKGDQTFNMSGGEQVRDFLPVEQVAENIVAIAEQNAVTGIINCSSGQPLKLVNLVNSYLKKRNSLISLNLGYYPYLDYEPMEFWGDNSKLQTILKNERP
jgi:nucleoside-diphosphate-sugar epimerase